MRARTIALVVVLVGLLTACGDDDSRASTTSTIATTSSSSATTTTEAPDWAAFMGFAECPPRGNEQAAGYNPDDSRHPAVVVMEDAYRHGSESQPGDETTLYYKGTTVSLDDEWLANDAATLQLVVCITHGHQSVIKTCSYSGGRSGIFRRQDLTITAYDARTGSVVKETAALAPFEGTSCPVFVEFSGAETFKILGAVFPDEESLQTAIRRLLSP